MLGLAAVAAMAVIAFIGAGSASATVLCKVTPTPNTTEAKCPAASTYGPGTVIEATSTNPTLTAEPVGVTCTHSIVKGETTTTGGASSTVLGTMTTFDFTGCKEKLFNTSCTVKSVNTSYLMELHWTSGSHNGTLTAKNHGFGEPGASVSCPFVGLNCVFGAEPTVNVTGGNPATVTATEVPLTIKAEGGFTECPEEAFWDATYTVLAPKPLWVGKEEE